MGNAGTLAYPLAPTAPARELALLQFFTIARIAGIPIRSNLLMAYLVALWAILGAARGYAGLTMVLIVLSMILLLLHELGHALAARRFGLRVHDIVLGPIGMARIDDMPENARVEGWIAAAGPLVNLVLAAAATPLLYVLKPGEPQISIDLPGYPVTIDDGALGIATLFVLLNLSYGVLNLLPAFPMDGGRLLRAFLARGGRDWMAATQRATSIGSVIAWTLIIGSLLRGACFVSLLGLYILWAGLKERFIVATRHRAEAFGGAQGRFAGWEALMQRARQQQQQGGGGPFGADPFDGDGPEGPTGPGDPGPGDSGGPSVGGSGGFSDEDIKKLESFRGRLQKPE